MNRRGFLTLLGAGAAVTAAGLAVPDVARRFFLPPAGGWNGWIPCIKDYMIGLDDFEERILAPAARKLAIDTDNEIMRVTGLNVGDVLTFGDVYDKQRTHLKQFIVTSVGDSRRVIAQLEPFNYRSPTWV